MAGMTEHEQPGANGTIPKIDFKPQVTLPAKGSTKASKNPIKFVPDPFSAGKTADNSLFSGSSTESKAGASSGPARDRRLSKEWGIP